jgi:hypothetical protein
MKNSAVLFLVGGLVASTQALDTVSVVKSISTIITVVEDKSPKLVRRGRKDCLDALQSATRILESATATMTSSVDEAFVTSLLSYADEHSSQSDAILNFCGTVTEKGLDEKYASETKAFQEVVSSTILPQFQKVNEECKDVDEAKDMLYMLELPFTACPSLRAQVTGTDLLPKDGAAAPRQTGAIMAAVGVAGLVVAAL